ncbi:MAG: carotenoid 1,2-hydratase [Pseudomonadota bacterium]
MSDCGTRAISIIAFIGSVFSPWYRWSGRKDPENHCCINVATYGPGGRFTMTDRGRSALKLTSDTMTVGPSGLRWIDDRLEIDIDEIGALPLVTPVKGRVTVHAPNRTDVELPLTEDGAHIWRPFAPRARIDVALEKSGWSWSGEGYLDANFGSRALEEDFSYWTWGRFPTPSGSICFYDSKRLDGSELNQTILFPHEGAPYVIPSAQKTRLPRNIWALRREIRSDPGATPRQVMPMLDAPFYSRALVETQLDGAPTIGVYEAVDLRRFRSPWLKPMLAVRVPRRPGWRFSDAETET